MLIKELLNEALYRAPYESRPIAPESLRLASFIKKHCRPWLSQTEYGELAVFRGSDSIKYPAAIKTVRTERAPKDSSQAKTYVLNTLISVVGGVANRNNSVFVSGKAMAATNYGALYVYIPIGNFNITWSPIWSDWFASAAMNDFYDMTNGFYSYDEVRTIWSGEDSIDISILNVEKVEEFIKTDDLKRAIRSGNEIMIQSQQGLYIDPARYDEVLNNL